MLEKRLPVPAELDRPDRGQQARPASLPYQQPVYAELDVLRRDRLQRAEHRHVEDQSEQLVGLDRIEAPVLEGRERGSPRDRLVERIARVHETDATAQLAALADAQRHEGAARSE